MTITAERKLKSAKRLRGAAEGQLTQVATFVAEFKVDQDEIEAIRSRKNTLEKARESFYTIQDEIEELTEAEEADLDERGEFEKLYCDLRAKCNSLIKKKEALHAPGRPYSREATPESVADSLPQSSSSSFGYSGKVNLPKQNLPTFNGDYTQWKSYFDAVEAMIFKNT